MPKRIIAELELNNISFEVIKESIETMCKRCINYEICQGTGCAPKNKLENLLEVLEKYE